MKTRYRTKNDGYVDFLQHKVTIRLFWLIPISFWTYIDYPYVEFSGMSYDRFICKYNTNFHSFMKRYPNIEEYFKYYKAEQIQLENEKREKERKREEKRKQKRYY